MAQNHKKRRPSIRMVAEHVDLSPTTVSLALRGDDSIPPETRDRVIVAARELNYDFSARSRKSKTKVKQLVYVIKDFDQNTDMASNPFYGQVLSGVQQACHDYDINLSFSFMDQDYPEAEALPMALTGDLDGIIMSSPYPPAILDRLAEERRKPIVLLDNIYPGCPYDTVMADDFNGGFLATQHLIDLGHKHILTIMGTSRNVYMPASLPNRHHGYREACYQAGLAILPRQVVPWPIGNLLEMEKPQILDWLKERLAAYPQVTAIFGTSDLFALGTIRALQSMGHRVPEDYSVVGYDDYDISELVTPPLTTFHSYKRWMGRLSVERLLARIDGDESPPQHIKVGGEFVLRLSTVRPSR